jgi:electron transport complex protein RnfB
MEPVPAAPEPAPTGWAAWCETQAATARERYAFHQWRVERDKRENDERLAAKAAAKLADLAAHSRLTDADALAAKRAVIEAALARAKARRGPEGAA